MKIPLLDTAPYFDWIDPVEQPQPGELHLWSWESAGEDDSLLLADPQASQDLQLLDEGERERYERFSTEELRQKFLVAHAVLRKLLGKYLGVSPESVAIIISPGGKPKLAPVAGKGMRELQFNLSHSGTKVLAAVSLEEVGVDVELIRPVTRLPALTARYMSPAEQLAIEQASDDQRMTTFFRLWTRKEAVVKLIGTGLQKPLGQLEVSSSENYVGAICFPAAWEAQSQGCWVANVPMLDPAIAAVACGQAIEKVICRQIGAI